MAELAFIAYSEGKKEYPSDYPPNRAARVAFRLLIKGDADALAEYEVWKEKETPQPLILAPPGKEGATNPEKEQDDRIVKRIRRIDAWAQSQHCLVDLWRLKENEDVNAKAQVEHRHINESAADQKCALFPPGVVEAALKNFRGHVGREALLEEMLESSAGILGWAFANLSAEDREAVLSSN